MSNGVAFRRINGRIVPIRTKGNQPQQQQPAQAPSKGYGTSYKWGLAQGVVGSINGGAALKSAKGNIFRAKDILRTNPKHRLIQTAVNVSSLLHLGYSAKKGHEHGSFGVFLGNELAGQAGAWTGAIGTAGVAGGLVYAGRKGRAARHAAKAGGYGTRPMKDVGAYAPKRLK